jgi:hypothetical protein
VKNKDVAHVGRSPHRSCSASQAPLRRWTARRRAAGWCCPRRAWMALGPHSCWPCRCGCNLCYSCAVALYAAALRADGVHVQNALQLRAAHASRPAAGLPLDVRQPPAAQRPAHQEPRQRTRHPCRCCRQLALPLPFNLGEVERRSRAGGSRRFVGAVEVRGDEAMRVPCARVGLSWSQECWRGFSSAPPTSKLDPQGPGPVLGPRGMRATFAASPLCHSSPTWGRRPALRPYTPLRCMHASALRHPFATAGAVIRPAPPARVPLLVRWWFAWPLPACPPAGAGGSHTTFTRWGCACGEAAGCRCGGAGGLRRSCGARLVGTCGPRALIRAFIRVFSRP